ncbi:MAG: N-acetylmuramoyl-L-alanine amidase [Dehalococcoidia bacterium]
MLDIRWIGSPYYDDRRDGRPLALVLHIAEGSLAGCDAWFNDPANVTSAHFAVARFVPGRVHQYVGVEASARANGIRNGAAPADHGHAAWLLDAIGPVASPNRFTVSIEHEGRVGDRLDCDVFATSVELAAMLWCPGGGVCTHAAGGVLPNGHGALAGVPCDRDHVLRHGEIGGHPACPGFDEAEIEAYIAAVNARLQGQPTAPAVPAPSPGAVVGLETHALDVVQTNEAANVIFAHFADVLFDSDGRTMLAVTGGVAVPEGRRAVLVVY